MKYSLTCLLIIMKYSCRSVYVFVFLQTDMWLSVRIYQSVHTEVSIVDLFPVIAAIIVNSFSIFSSALINRMVAPLPDKSAAKCIIFLDKLEIVLQISRAISHSMAVLYQKERFFRILFHIFFYFRKCRVHSSDYINIGIIIFPVRALIKSTFICSESGRVKFFCPL